MINFDPSAVSFEIVRLKSITQALGGSIQIIDEERTVDKNEVTKRLPLPLSVARAFIMRHHKVTKYLIPVYIAIVRYEDRIISLERHPLGGLGELYHENLSGERVMWEPQSKRNFESLIAPYLYKSIRDWYFDGRYVYSFEEPSLQDTVDIGVPLTDDKRFRKLPAISIDFQEMSNQDKLDPTIRSCLAYVSDTKEFAISPPIWKEAGQIGASRRERSNDAAMPVVSFDEIDETMWVNLNFILRAGKMIGSSFGYEYIEPLQLPRLMVELHTVNLPNISVHIKSTYNSGFKFTHVLAWLLGLNRKSESLDTYIMMRSLMKYLTTKGIFRNNTFQASTIFVDDNQTVKDVQLINLDQLLDTANYTRESLNEILSQTNKPGTKRIGANQFIGLQTEQD